MSKYYIAYGSNLNKKQMKNRCPDAKLIATGSIPDYQLLFRGGGNAVATIEPFKTGTVPYGLWVISEKDEKNLDIYEGFPRLYYKESFTVKLDGKDVDALVYIMNLDLEIGCPSEEYYETVEQGYKDCGLDIDKLEEALDRCSEQFYTQKDVRNLDMGMK